MKTTDQGPLRVQQVIQVLEELRKVHPSINSNAVIAFLLVCTRPGLTVTEVSEALHQSLPATARILAMLQKYHRRGTLGLDLIYNEQDHLDHRVRHLYLTPKGKRIWASIRGILQVKGD